MTSAYEKTYPTEDYRLSATDAADLLGKCLQYVRILARTGRIPAVKVCGQWKFCKQQILDQVRQDTEETINKATLEGQRSYEKRLAESSDLF